MPIIDPASIQHTLQMSTAVERVVVETMAHHAVDQARKEERLELDAQKQNEVQDPENTEESNPTDPEGKGSRRQIRIKKKKISAEMENKDEEKPPPVAEGDLGTRVDFIV